MSKTRRGQRKTGADNYPTPEWAIKRFLEEWEDLHRVGPRWIEPCAGDGVIVDVVNHFRSGIDWTAVELRDTTPALHRVGLRPDQIRIGDFFALFPGRLPGKTHTALSRALAPDQPFDVAILNPPFRLTMAFILRCFEIARTVVVMQRVNYLGSEDRNEWFRANIPDLYVLPNRVSFTGDGKADGLEHAWHTWGPHPRVGVGELRLLKATPLEERKLSYRRIVVARDETAVTLDALFTEAAS